jgi:hypothetical protein
MKIITRAAAKRLGILGVILVMVVVCFQQAMISMPGKSFRAALPPMTPEQKALSEALRRDMKVLAGTIGERNVFRPKTMVNAAAFVEQALGRSGLQVRRQNFPVLDTTCDNLEVEIPGQSMREESVVVGAHYDALHGTVGANDNGSGVVALFALAELLAKSAPARTLRLVAFANEEPPFFQTNAMGSWVCARAARTKGEKVVAMISLETMGYYSDAPGSQHYPFPLGAFYPSRGDFIAFVGNTASKKLVRDCIAVFRKEMSFPSEGGALPAGLPGVGWSDHWAFWQEGYPALMVTDTAPFRYPHYHTPDDTPDKVDYDRLARVTEGLEKVIRSLLNPAK